MLDKIETHEIDFCCCCGNTKAFEKEQNVMRLEEGVRSDYVCQKCANVFDLASQCRNKNHRD